ncbi:MAG: hypothetical protein LQ352_005752 [Teloschistes flavicans]|nr:MAG: hypothetical protein LQ352_005752 [Teloschistes flavicans]
MAPVEVPTQGKSSDQVTEDSTAEHGPYEQPKTPRRRDKRLRFSEPIIQNIDDSSTGLTPALNRTKLISQQSIKKAKQRPSLPAQLGLTAGISSTSPIEIQFTPLRQAIDPRMMRRLKRNHMGEEINKVYAEKQKSKLDLQQQIEELRGELALAREQGNQITNEPEQRTDGVVRIAELEQELGNLKQEMVERSTTVDCSLPASGQSSAATTTSINLDDSNDVCQIFDESVSSGHQEPDQVTQASPPVIEAATQTLLTSPALIEVFRSARLTLEHLFPGENSIGLDITDPEPLLGTIISRLQSMKAKANKIEKECSVIETSTANMGRHFNNALSRLERGRAQIKALHAEIATEKARASSAELEIATLEAHCENANEKCNDLKKQRDEHALALERLRPAYEHYQKECEKLTKTIMEMESSHEKAMAGIRDEMSTSNGQELSAQQLLFEEAKSDLEAQITAESTGRRKAEESAVERLARIKELETHQKELQAAINEKQSILRTLDDDLKQSQLGREQEVGQLNVRISELTSELTDTEIELGVARHEIAQLNEGIKQEKAAGLKAVEEMQGKMEKCAGEVKSVKSDYVDGLKEREFVGQSFGLITPVVEGGRFRDAEADEKVEGHVELTRGKKRAGRAQRPDSGVELWDMMDLDRAEDYGQHSDL